MSTKPLRFVGRPSVSHLSAGLGLVGMALAALALAACTDNEAGSAQSSASGSGGSGEGGGPTGSGAGGAQGDGGSGSTSVVTSSSTGGDGGAGTTSAASSASASASAASSSSSGAGTGGGPEQIAEVFAHSSDTLYRVDLETNEVETIGDFDGCGSILDTARPCRRRPARAPALRRLLPSFRRALPLREGGRDRVGPRAQHRLVRPGSGRDGARPRALSALDHQAPPARHDAFRLDAPRAPRRRVRRRRAGLESPRRLRARGDPRLSATTGGAPRGSPGQPSRAARRARAPSYRAGGARAPCLDGGGARSVGNAARRRTVVNRSGGDESAR